MTDTRAKGNRHEREAEKLYQEAGYRTERSTGQRWGRTDWFGLYDIMAIQPGMRVRFVQVKTGKAQGIREFINRGKYILPLEHARDEYLVRHVRGSGDPAAWRLLRRKEIEDDVTYRTVIDERKMDCDLGEAVTDYLSGEVPDER